MTFDSVDDPANPKNWSYTRKVLITMLFGTTTMCSTFASSVFSSASPYISEQFGVGRQVTVLGISLFIAGYIFGPLLWSSLSEQYGRKGTILVPVFLFMCLTAMTATAKDLQVSKETRSRFRNFQLIFDVVGVSSLVDDLYYSLVGRNIRFSACDDCRWRSV